MTDNLAQEELKIIELLSQNELTISKLYSTYAEKFPEYAEFWTKIAQEEVNHSDAVLKLTKYLDNKKLFFNPDRFTQETINHSINFKKKLIEEAQTQNISFINAISMAFTLEEALLEKNFFEIFETDDPKFQEAMDYLAKSTQKHIREIKAVWQKAQRTLVN